METKCLWRLCRSSWQRRSVIKSLKTLGPLKKTEPPDLQKVQHRQQRSYHPRHKFPHKDLPWRRDRLTTNSRLVRPAGLRHHHQSHPSIRNNRFTDMLLVCLRIPTTCQKSFPHQERALCHLVADLFPYQSISSPDFIVSFEPVFRIWGERKQE